MRQQPFRPVRVQSDRPPPAAGDAGRHQTPPERWRECRRQQRFLERMKAWGKWLETRECSGCMAGKWACFQKTRTRWSGLEGLTRWPNRILRGLPNTTKLTMFYFRAVNRPAVDRSAKNTIPSFFCSRFVPRVVIPAMNPLLIAVPETSRSEPLRAGFAVGRSAAGKKSLYRHATCISAVFIEKDSQSLHESVDFRRRRAKVASDSRKERDSLAIRSRLPVERPAARRQVRWNHGAARNGNRKRTRVRVACGGGIRPRGLGHQPIHGHFGLSVVLRGMVPHVVHQPACEFRIRQRHLSRGAGLLAALMTRDTNPARTSPLERRPARKQIGWATRLAGCNVIRAATVLTSLPERPAAGRGGHNPSPRTRLRLG